MNNLLFLLVILFAGLVLVLLLAGWIYTRLEESGAFGINPRGRRVGALIFLGLPVLCGLTLIPGALFLAGQAPPGLSAALPALPEPPGAPDEPSGKIVFTCQVFIDMTRDQICLIQPDGSGWRRLTQNDRGDYTFPSLAPDGQSVVFAGNENGATEIYELALDGETRQLTDGMDAAFAPEISPDGRRVVFARRAEEHQSIWVMDRDGGNPVQIFGPPAGDGWDPTWSPDGRRILFASTRVGGVQLFSIEPDGSNLVQVSDLEGIRGRSDWSSQDLIITYSGESWQREIFVMGPDGSGEKQITQGGNNLAPSFSPDGEWVVFMSYRDRYRDDNGCEIYIMRQDGSQVSRLTDNEYCDWQPRWGN